MRERVEIVGGTFKIESTPGHGTLVSAEIPFPYPSKNKNSMKESITVLLAEDHVVVREGLRILIEADGDIKVVGEAKTGREAVQLAAKLQPDVIVMDIAMPLLNGIQAAQQILGHRPKARFSFCRPTPPLSMLTASWLWVPQVI